ncbi:hypothetical protein GCM10029964_010610 [Kibdelosporangium lantanae]
MADRARSVPSTARFGLTDDRADVELRAAGWWGDSGPVKAAEQILTAFSRSPDPDLALRGIDRLRESVGTSWDTLDGALRADVDLRGALIAVLGTSTALSDFLVANPDAWHRLHEDDPPDLLEAVDGLTGADAVRALRQAYRARLLLIAADDLAHVVEPSLRTPAFEDVTTRLTILAEEALRAALAVAHAEIDAKDARLAVIAMGKCGGRELNYVSDVDVVFVGEEPGHRDQAGQPHDDRRRLGLFRGRRGPATRRQGRRPGPHARRPCGVLQALGAYVGVPGAAQSPAGGR